MPVMLRKNLDGRQEGDGEDFPYFSSSSSSSSFSRSVVAAAAASNDSAAAAAERAASPAAAGEKKPPLPLLSPDTPLAEVLMTFSSSLSASDEFAVDRLRARGVDTAGSLADLVFEELLGGGMKSSSSSSSSLSNLDEKAAVAVATATRLPLSVVAAICAAVEAARKEGTEAVASVTRQKSRRSPKSAATAKKAAAAAVSEEQDEEEEEKEEKEEKLLNNVLTFRPTPDPTLRGCAARSRNDRLLVAPPTDPRWAERAISASSSSSSSPPLVDEAVTAVLMRRIPQGDRYFHGDPKEVRVTKAKAGSMRGNSSSGSSSSGKGKAPKSFSPATESYALHPRDTPPRLARELDDFHRFWTVRFPGQQQQPVAVVTADKYVDHLRRMLGWAVAEGKVRRGEGAAIGERANASTLSAASAPKAASKNGECGDGGGDEHNEPFSLSAATPPDLSLRDLLPDSTREGASLVMEYAAWLARARGVTPHTEGLAVRSALSAAKFLFHSRSRARVASGERPYQDLEVVSELRGMSREAREAGKRAPGVADEAAKWLDWPDFLAVVEELRREAGAVNDRGRRRSDAAVAWSLQKYLMFAILACVPDRQRTVRDLDRGRTLFFESGKWVIRHGAGDYKTGRVYGTRPPLQLDESLYPELHAYLSTWRQCLNPKHDFVFTMKSGVSFFFPFPTPT